MVSATKTSLDRWATRELFNQPQRKISLVSTSAGTCKGETRTVAPCNDCITDVDAIHVWSQCGWRRRQGGLNLQHHVVTTIRKGDDPQASETGKDSFGVGGPIGVVHRIWLPAHNKSNGRVPQVPINSEDFGYQVDANSETGKSLQAMRSMCCNSFNKESTHVLTPETYNAAHIQYKSCGLFDMTV